MREKVDIIQIMKDHGLNQPDKLVEYLKSRNSWEGQIWSIIDNEAGVLWEESGFLNNDFTILLDVAVSPQYLVWLECLENAYNHADEESREVIVKYVRTMIMHTSANLDELDFFNFYNSNRDAGIVSENTTLGDMLLECRISDEVGARRRDDSRLCDAVRTYIQNNSGKGHLHEDLVSLYLMSVERYNKFPETRLILEKEIQKQMSPENVRVQVNAIYDKRNRPGLQGDVSCISYGLELISKLWPAEYAFALSNISKGKPLTTNDKMGMLKSEKRIFMHGYLQKGVTNN